MEKSRIVWDVTPELKNQIQTKAKENNQSISGYLEMLVTQDLSITERDTYAETHQREILSKVLVNVKTVINHPSFQNHADDIMRANLNNAREELQRYVNW